MKKVLFFAFTLLACSTAFAQNLDPVKWQFQAEKVADNEYNLTLKAYITDGWYVYSQYLESDDGPVRTSFTFNENSAVEFVGKVEEAGSKHEGFDDLFGMNVIKFSGQPIFTQRVKAASGTTISGYLEFMTCDNERCLPPKEVDFTFTLQ